MTVPVLLLIAGLVALGLPKVTHRDQKRFWHPWLNVGVLPMVLGAVISAFLNDGAADRLKPLLAAALVAGGLLVGTQLRVAYLLRAGSQFIFKQSQAAGTVWLVAAALITLVCYLGGGGRFTVWACVGIGMTLASFLLATAQMPPWASGGFEITHRDIVTGHIAPAGWWNLIAMVIGGAALTLFFGLPVERVGLSWPGWSVLCAEFAFPIFLGLGLGWLSVRSRNRDEAYMFLLSMIACGAGGALFFGSSPLFNGLLIGAAFINASLGRAALVEQAVEELEQPIAISAGLLSGLVAGAVFSDWPIWGLFGVIFLLRLVMRGFFSPTSTRLATRLERQVVAPGATGILLTAGLVFVEPPYDSFFIPALALLVAHTLLAECTELLQRRGVA